MDERGVALVLTLAILVITTILVVGFATSMRTERHATASMANNVTAIIFAGVALDHAIAILDKNIPQPVAPGASTANPTNWIINPGLLKTVQGASTLLEIPLSSNPSPTYSSTNLDANLNVPQVSGTGFTILPTSAPMRVAWVPVLQDPVNAPGPTNKISGRYAFWIDDENSKVDINTAYGKPSAKPDYSALNADSYTYGVPSFFIPIGTAPPAPTSENPYSLGRPSSVSLDVLPGINRNALWNDRLQRVFRSPSEAARYGLNFQANKFWLTAWSRDPEFNPFGKSKIFLTDSTFQLGNASTTPPTIGSVGFAYASEVSTTATPLRDPKELLTFHSDGNSSASTSVDAASNPTVAAVNEIAGYLNTRFPGFSKTFVEKWSSTPGTADTQGFREAQQVAWNIYGMAASAANETNNGKWANQTPASARPAPTPTRFAALLWDGPRPTSAWPASKILPQTRSPLLTRLGVSFIATQYKRTGTVDTALRGTSKYRVNVRIAPQVMLPVGYQGFQQFDPSGAGQPWKLTNDEIYITHFEATIDDGSGSGSKRVIWSSEAPSDNGSLYYDPSGGTKLYKFAGNSIILNPDGQSVNFAASITGWNFSSSDNTVGVTPSRTISFIFDAGPTQFDCNISDVRIRFVVTTGSGAFITPYQISPIRDIDGANGFEPFSAQDAGSIVLPPFQIPTNSIAASTPEYWLITETLDPRVNQRGTPSSGPTATDDWQSSTSPSIIPPITPTRGTRLAPAYPTVGPSGDESKLAWLDASPYVVNGSTKTRWGMSPGHFNSRMPTVGLISCISTGIQSGVSWRTLRLQPTSDDPPDWVLLDLFAVPFNRVAFISGKAFTDPNSAPFTQMNSAAGKININATIFPTSFGLSPNAREAPIKALLADAYRPNVVAPGSPTPIDPSLLFGNIAAYLDAKPSHSFDYPGEICQVPGVAGSGMYEWEKEAVVRNLASLITTRSSAFSVWGVAQTVKKNPSNNNPLNQGSFETRAAGAVADDTVTGERRFHSVIERYVWPGVDLVPGNAMTNAAGNYSQLGSTAYIGSTTNAVDATDPSQTAFSQSFNPAAASIKYRVIYFEYIN